MSATRKYDQPKEDLFRLKVSKHTHDRIKEAAAQKQMCTGLYIEHLQDFYELKYLDDIILRLKQQYLKGLNATTIAHLSVLYTFLQEVDRKVGLS